MLYNNAINLREYDNFIDSESCKKIIALGEAGMQKATTLGEDKEGYRIADTMFFDPNEKLLKRIREVIAKRINLPIDNQEHMSIIRYKDTEKGVFQAHYDCFAPTESYFEDALKQGGQRVKTCLIYLNEGFEGGQTEFPNMDLRITPKAGKLVIWDNVDKSGNVIPEALHAGLEVTKGTKYLLSIWVREFPFDNTVAV